MPPVRVPALLLLIFLTSHAAAVEMGMIRGRVVDADSGEPITNAAIHVTGVSTGIHDSSISTADGSYALSLPPDDYRLAALAEGCVAQKYEGINCRACVGKDGIPVTVRSAQVTTGIDFALHRAGFVEGTLVDVSTGRAIVESGVVVYDAVGRYVTEAMATASGYYKSDAVLAPDEPYYVEAFAPNYLRQFFDGIYCANALQCLQAGATPVWLPGFGLSTRADFRLTAGGSIRGTVRDTDSSHAVPNATLEIYDSSGVHVTTAWTMVDGTFRTLPILRAGDHYVRTRTQEYADVLYDGIPCIDGCLVTNGRKVTVVAGGVTSGVDFSLTTRLSRISGRVVDKITAAPIAGAHVAFHREHAASITAVTDSDGRFVTERVDPGRYYGEAFADGRYQRTLYGGEPCIGSCNRSGGQAIDVAAATTRSGVDFALSSLWIDSVTPSTIAWAGTRVVIRGNGFVPGTEVQIGGTTAEIEMLSPDFMVVRAPVHPTGPADLVVTSSGHSVAFFEPLNYTGRQAYRVKNIAAYPRNGRQVRPPIGTLGDTFYYVGRDPLYGIELWRSDGRPEGTRQVADLCPGTCSSAILDGAVAAGLIFFNRGNEDGSLSLWRSDGTSGGTFPLRSFEMGANGLLEFRGLAYFTAYSEGRTELWSSDGTVAGTMRLLSFETLGIHTPLDFKVVKNHLVFRANGDKGAELYVTDGTAAATRLIDVAPGPMSSQPGNTTVIGDEIFFLAYSTNAGRQVWKWSERGGLAQISDPSSGIVWNDTTLAAAGTRLVGLLRDSARRARLFTPRSSSKGVTFLAEVPLAGAHSYAGLHSAGNLAYFFSTDSENGARLWVTDGTSEGTAPISGIGNAAGERIAALNHQLVFHTREAQWISDGTAAGTRIVRFMDESTVPLYLTPGDRLLFYFEDDNVGISLVATDGISTTTATAIDLGPSSSSSPRNFVVSNDTLYFVAGSELWRSDGTEQGTYQFADLPNPTSGFTDRTRILAVGDTLYFPLRDGNRGLELWRSDGTPSGTRIVKDIAPGYASAFRSEADPLIAFEGAIYFLASNDGYMRSKLWKTDGSESGTAQVSNLEFERLIASRSRLFLLSCALTCRLAASDGTGAGTRLIASAPDSIIETAVAGDLLYFSDGLHRIWRSDGTEAGTFELLSLSGPVPPQLEPVGNRMFIAHDNGLWVTDGRPSATSFIGNYGSSYGRMRGAGSLLYFVAGSSGTGYALWRSDGTTDGTFPIEYGNTHPGLAPFALQAVGEELSFVTMNPVGATTLWRSNGTSDGTLPIASGIREPYAITATRTHLFFSGDDSPPASADEDVELWAIRLSDVPRRRAVRAQ